MEAESQSDSEQQKKLLAAAKMLADATARMVEAAKVNSFVDEGITHCCTTSNILLQQSA
jgi:hypothetical protein